MKLDPITLEVLNHKLTAIAEEMCLTLQRTGKTLYVKETADFACAIADLDGKFFAYPNDMGVSGFVGLDCLPTIEAVGELAEGDVIITNDPYRSQGLATHLPDVQVIAPFFSEGKIIAYGWAFLHASDLGGNVPSSISPRNNTIYQEGLQIAPLKLLEQGRWNTTFLTLLRNNVRDPDSMVGALNAMVAALEKGRHRVNEVIAQHGVGQFLQAQSDLLEYSERRASDVLRSIPEQSFTFTDYLDDEAGVGWPLRIKLTLTRQGDQVMLDFTGTDIQSHYALNIASNGKPHSWVVLRLLIFICSLDDSIPINYGIVRPIRVNSQAGSLVYAVRPAAVGVRHASAVRVSDSLNGALALALPELMPAASGGTIVPVVVAEAKADGSNNVQVVEPLVGGTGARKGADGTDGRDSSISNLSNNPVEAVEAELGIRILRYGLRPDPGGPGQWRGGCGQVLRFELLSEAAELLARGMERLRYQPWGAMGGLPGMPMEVVLNPDTTKAQAIATINVLALQQGDVIEFRTPGGGGWGDPLQRPVEAVQQDVRLGLVTVEHALENYGVVMNADGSVNIEQTDTQRQSRQANNAAVLTQINHGAFRQWWDSVLPEAELDSLIQVLFNAPPIARNRLRNSFFQAVFGEDHMHAVRNYQSQAAAPLQQAAHQALKRLQQQFLYD